MSKFQQKRSVIILAISKDNPIDIYGYCPGYEKTKFPSSGWSRRRVYLFECDQCWESIYLRNSTGLYGMTGKERWDFKSKTEGCHGWSAKRQMLGKVTMLKKLLRSKPTHARCGRSPNEYNWKFAKQEAARMQKELNRNGHKNFEVRCFRTGSKICPVEVDLSERQEMFYCSSKWNKDRWMKPRFRLKPLEDKQEPLTI